MNTPDAEFDRFLADATSEIEHKEQAQLRASVAMDACDAGLEFYNVPTTYRFDDDKRLALQGDEILEDPDLYVTTSYHLLNLATLVDLCTQPYDSEYMTDCKKQLMADIHVDLGAAPNSEWMQFIDGMLPGNPLDFNSVDDLQYLSNAQQKHDKLHQDTDMYTESILIGAGDVLGLEFTQEELTLYLIIYLDVLELVTKNEHERAARIDEIIRQYGVSHDYVNKVIKVVEDGHEHAQE